MTRRTEPCRPADDQPAQRLALLREAYNAVAEAVESFECDDRVGPDLAYLLGALLNNTCCAWPEGRAILTILRECLPPGHPVFRFIEIDHEGPHSATESTGERPMKRADELPHEQLVAIVERIQAALWHGGEGWDADKTWDAETIEYVAGVLEKAGLRPDEPSEVGTDTPATPSDDDAEANDEADRPLVCWSDANAGPGRSHS